MEETSRQTSEYRDCLLQLTLPNILHVCSFNEVVISVTPKVKDCLGEPLGQWPDETTTLACRPSHRPEKETGSSEEGVAAGRPWDRETKYHVGRVGR